MRGAMHYAGQFFILLTILLLAALLVFFPGSSPLVDDDATGAGVLILVAFLIASRSRGPGRATAPSANRPRAPPLG